MIDLKRVGDVLEDKEREAMRDLKRREAKELSRKVALALCTLPAICGLVLLGSQVVAEVPKPWAVLLGMAAVTPLLFVWAS